MNEEQVRALISSMLNEHKASMEQLLEPLMDSLSDTVREYMGRADQRLSDIETYIDGGIQAGEDGEVLEGLSESSPIAQRLAKMERELKDYQQREAELQQQAEAKAYEEHLSQLVDPYKPQFRSEALSYLKQSLGEVTKDETAGYLTKDGRTLSEATESFFKSDFGRHLLPSQQQSGTGTQRGTAPSTESGDLSAQLRAAFL